jgi:hypothetical protein
MRMKQEEEVEFVKSVLANCLYYVPAIPTGSGVFLFPSLRGR